MNGKFGKRVFTPQSMVEILTDIVRAAPTMPGTFTSGRISPAFRERILLAVTSVNRCRYCQWVHSDLAAANGISADQIASLLGSSTQSVPEEEKVALLYALHYAETNRNPSPLHRQQLVDTYGSETAHDIENWIHLIFFSNLSGNTFDAFLSRLRGEPNPEGNAIFEAMFAVLSAPVLLSLAALSKNSVNPLVSLEHN
ncbi:MAG TPA: carboxymuconolactone decarboxylase family protein [Turneriella sp.]|nr:carboxymuconolactone decarboxylase family protein [Turneriella sp.]HNE19297.1 carboxymuconolactone decarboxylase family protein [Turneriella sp.]HNJ65033.1 carboxymuconolactone decarboxylase family protein [Turneriella sp.]HNM99523.1 carboxymuconolactone decarboxylase family protein [Turneriella sp.]